jgi:hypothetical protein
MHCKHLIHFTLVDLNEDEDGKTQIEHSNRNHLMTGGKLPPLRQSVIVHMRCIKLSFY